MVTNYLKATKNNWQLYWQNKNFRRILITGAILMSIILFCFPYFFQYIEQRKGTFINDVILNAIHPQDVSLYIFIFIWSSAFFMLITVIKHPDTFITFLIAYIIISALRIITISVFPLETPHGIIALTDPLSNHFYGVPFITKDLFFSGHTCTVFLMYLCQKNKIFKYYSLAASVCIAILVLVQHIHYTVDVIFAIPLGYLCYLFSRKLLKHSSIASSFF